MKSLLAVLAAAAVIAFTGCGEWHSPEPAADCAGHRGVRSMTTVSHIGYRSVYVFCVDGETVEDYEGEPE